MGDISPPFFVPLFVLLLHAHAHKKRGILMKITILIGDPYYNYNYNYLVNYSTFLIVFYNY